MANALEDLLQLQQSEGLLTGLSEQGMRDLAEATREVRRAAGEVLIRAGESGENIYFVLSGKVSRALGNHDQEATTLELGPGGILGGVALLAGGRHMEDVEVIEDCRLAALSDAALEDLQESSPETWYQVSKVVLGFMRRQQLALHLHRLLGGLGQLDRELLQWLESEVSWQNVESGGSLFRQGDPADSVYVVMNGRLQVVLEKPDGTEAVLNEVGVGETLGEMAVIANDPRSASVYAVRDTDLAKISLVGFRLLMFRRPEAMLGITRLIVDRLRRRENQGRNRPPRPNCIALIPARAGIDIEPLIHDLTRELETHGSVISLESESVDTALGKEEIAQARPDDPSHLRLSPWLQQLEQRYDFLLYCADANWSAWSERCVNQAAVVLIVADAEADPGADGALLKQLEEVGRSGKRVALVLRHPAGTDQPRGTAAWLDALPVKEHYHVRSANPGDLARLGRSTIGEAIGLVFGGGAARGFAHIGVFKALSEAGIPIDFVGGSSIGSTFAAPIALGWDPDQLLTLARDSFVDKSILNDYSVPVVSLLKGEKLEKMAKHHFDADIEDLWRPFFAVTTNLSLGEMIILDRGPTWKAVRSSVALPGILPPAVDGNSLLIDGGILNNLPIDIMRAQPGVGWVIAVDLYTPKEYELPYTKVPSAWQILRSRYLPWIKRVRVPGIVTLMMKATEIASIVHAKEVRDQADLWLNPPVYKFGILATDKFDQIVEVGYEDAKEHLAAWSGPRTPQ